MKTFLVPFEGTETVLVGYEAKINANSHEEAFNKLQGIIQAGESPHNYNDEIDGHFYTIEASVNTGIIEHVHSDWKDYFKPVTYDYDGDDMIFSTFADACEYVEKNLNNTHYDDWDDTAKQAASKPYQHIWSIVDGESGKLILLNGYHKVNVLDYLVCKTPWGTGKDSDKDVYLEIEYEE